jgi:hypothetical protein
VSQISTTPVVVAERREKEKDRDCERNPERSREVEMEGRVIFIPPLLFYYFLYF